MCSKDKNAPLQLLIILTICTSCLLVHFVAEDLAPVVDASGSGLAGQGGWSHLICENCDEQFIFPFPNGMPTERPTVYPEILAAMNVSSYAISPLLPPPNS